MAFTPHRLEEFSIVCPIYLGSMKFLEPLAVFLQFNEDSTLRRLVLDLKLGIAVDSTEAFMRAIQNFLDYNRRVIYFKFPQLRKIKNLKLKPENDLTWR